MWKVLKPAVQPIGQLRTTRWELKAIEVVLTLIFYVVCIFGVLTVLGISVSPTRSVSTGVPVITKLDVNKLVPGATSKLPPEVTTDGVDATVTVKPASLTDAIWARVQVLPEILLAVAGLVLLRRIVSSVIRSEPFTKENVIRIRLIALLLALVPVATEISQVATHELVRHSVVSSLMYLQFQISLLPFLAAGLVIVLAEVFAAGVELRKDSDGLI